MHCLIFYSLLTIPIAAVTIGTIDDCELHKLALLKLIFAIGHGNEQLAHLLDGAFDLHRGTIGGIFNRD